MCYKIFNPKKNTFVVQEDFETIDGAMEEAQKITERDGSKLEVFRKCASIEQIKKINKDFF